MTITDPDASKNAWRIGSPGVEGWTRTARPGDPDKYYMVSADCHVTESLAFLQTIEPEYRDRIPHVEVQADGAQYMICEGNRPQLVMPGSKSRTVQAQQSFERPEHNRFSRERMEAEDLLRVGAGRSVEQRLADQARDGVDVEVLFPTTGLLCWATPDPVFAMAMCRTWNRWALDHVGVHMQGDDPKVLPMALVATGDQEGAEAEIRWAVDHGFRGVCLGNAPIYGPTEFGRLQYNDPSFESMWCLLEETGLVTTFHVSTGKDPRATGGNGGAIVNYVCHSMETTIEPLVQMIASGVFERHPRLDSRPRRERHRLPALVDRDDGPRLPRPSLLGAAGHPRVALALLPPALLRHVPARLCRADVRGGARSRRQRAVGQRLPPSRGLVAALRRRDRAHDG